MSSELSKTAGALSKVLMGLGGAGTLAAGGYGAMRGGQDTYKAIQESDNPAQDAAASGDKGPRGVEGEDGEDAYSPEEQRSFERVGLDPKRLKFTRTLSDLMQGMNLQDEMMGRAMSGVRRNVAPAEPSYGEYA